MARPEALLERGASPALLAQVGLGALLAMSSSCAVYSPPAGEPLAALEISGPAVGAFILNDGTCASRSGVPKSQWSGVQVAAGRRVTVELQYERVTDTFAAACSISMSFVARPNALYSLRFQTEYEFDKLTRCGYTLTVVAGDPDPRATLASVRREPVLSCGL